MPTTDQLQTQVNSLQGSLSSLSDTVSQHGTTIHNLTGNVENLLLRMIAAEQTLQQHRAELDQHRLELNDHEARLKKIEENSFKFSVLPYYKNQGKNPSVNSRLNVIELFMAPFTKDELLPYNKDVSGLVEFKLYQKIFNPNCDNGNVTFDFYNSYDWLKSISLGPHSQIILPIPIKVVSERPNRRLVIQSAKEGLVCTQQFFEFEKENVITFYNFTNSTINIMTNDLYFI